MSKKISSRTTLLLVICSLILAACAVPQEEAIQGAWYNESAHLKPITGEDYLITEWFFDRGTFEHKSCCFLIDLQIAGRYEIVETKEDIITIRLLQVRGSNMRFDGALIRIVIEDDGSLNIQGDGPYTHSLP